MHVLDTLLEITNILSEYLQREWINLQGAKEVADSSVETLKGYRTDVNLKPFGLRHASLCMIEYDLQEPVLGRTQRPPWRIAEGSSSGDRFSDAKQSFRVTYYEFIDVLLEELNTHFKDREFSALVSVEKLFMSAFTDSEPSEDSLTIAAKFYQSDIDEKRLRNELKVSYSFVKRQSSNPPKSQSFSCLNC